ncbi:hypothetical protein QQY66_30620 [Streptomyces sp. DG2A-72]|uniref:hypothetical protein n=1 Tax=Streptomyces sp. DG2A-72 TaxID=3051386 RepID=UPI00265BFD2B|nr:hypothetical protein [Streptomyces sp. DG2A-72]MDO0935828.1 hypothetical protein [Streptomyces sp. DG2A-72]
MERDDWRFTGEPAELLEKFLPNLRRINPDFEKAWIKDWHFSKAGFAQPVVTPEYRSLIPGHDTPMSRGKLATMVQIYLQDRGAELLGGTRPEGHRVPPVTLICGGTAPPTALRWWSDSRTRP